MTDVKVTMKASRIRSMNGPMTSDTVDSFLQDIWDSPDDFVGQVSRSDIEWTVCTRWV